MALSLSSAASRSFSCDHSDLFDDYDAVFARWTELADPTCVPSGLSTWPSQVWADQAPNAWPTLCAPVTPFWAHAYARLTQRYRQHQPLPKPNALQAWTCALTQHTWTSLPDETFCLWCEQETLWTLSTRFSWAAAVYPTHSGWLAVHQTDQAVHTLTDSCTGTSLRRTLISLLTVLHQADLTESGLLYVPTQSIYKAVTQGWLHRWRTQHWQTHDCRLVAHADLWEQLPAETTTLHWHWEQPDAPFWQAAIRLAGFPA